MGQPRKSGGKPFGRTLQRTLMDRIARHYLTAARGEQLPDPRDTRRQSRRLTACAAKHAGRWLSVPLTPNHILSDDDFGVAVV